MNKIKEKIYHFFVKITYLVFIKVRDFMYIKSIRSFFKNKNSKYINSLRLLFVIIGIIFINIFILNLQECNIIIGYILAILFQFAISLFLMVAFISMSLEKNIKNRKVIAFTTNIIFPLTTTILLYNYNYTSEIYFQIINLLFMLLILYLMKKCIKINKGDDISYLKEMNHLFSIIMCL